MRPAVLALLLAALAAPAAAADWRFSSSVNYETGKYGGGASVDTVSVPFTLKRYFRDTDISLTVPWVSQSSTGEVTRAGGRPLRAAPGAAPRRGSNSGIGDAVVRGAYRIKRDGPGSFGFALAGKLKLPTANEEKGLGTGELDQGAGFDFDKELNQRWTLLAGGFYTIVGDPEGADYNNSLETYFGLLRPLGGGLALTVLYETSSALLDGAADPRLVYAELSGPLKGGEGWTCGLGLGLSEGSPALALGAGVWKKF